VGGAIVDESAGTARERADRGPTRSTTAYDRGGVAERTASYDYAATDDAAMSTSIDHRLNLRGPSYCGPIMRFGGRQRACGNQHGTYE
jgi:hypothetical protein